MGHSIVYLFLALPVRSSPNEIRESDFITRAGGVALTSDGRRAVLRAYERRLSTTITHPIFKYKVSYRRVLDVQARLLAAALVGEVPDYVPMVTQWPAADTSLPTTSQIPSAFGEYAQ